MAAPSTGTASREAIEDHAPLGFGHTRAFVLHGDDREVAFVPDNHADLTGAVLCGVVDQIGDDLCEATLVACDNEMLERPDVDGDVVGGVIHRLPNELDEIDRFGSQ